MTKEPTFSLFFAFFCVLFFVIFGYTLPIMAGVYIVGELGGSNYISIYGVTFYSIGNALGVPLGAALHYRIGIVRMLVGCLILFAFFSYLCGSASHFPFFIGARLLQGVVSGPFYTLTNRLFAYFTPEKKKIAFTSITLTILAVVPVIGATWGGFLAYEFHWRWIFYANIPFILVLAWFIGTRLRGYDAMQQKTIQPAPFDVVGYVFYCVSVFCLSFVFTTGQELDWFRSPLLNTLIIVGLVSGLFFVLWSLHHPYPIFHLKLLTNPVFCFALFNLACLFSAYFGMVILLSLWLKLYVQYTPIWIGALIGTMAIAGILPSFLISKEWARTDCRLPLLIAVGFLAISCFHTALFDVEINFGRIAFSRVCAGFGLVLFLPPIFRLCFRSFPEEESLNVLVLFQFVRALSSGLGASFYTILWQRREIFYHERLGSKLTAFSQQTQLFFEKAMGFQLQGKAADAQLDFYLERQAISLALDDCFYFMGCVLIGLLVLIAITLFFRKQAAFFPEKKTGVPQSIERA